MPGQVLVDLGDDVGSDCRRLEFTDDRQRLGRRDNHDLGIALQCVTSGEVFPGVLDESLLLFGVKIGGFDGAARATRVLPQEAWPVRTHLRRVGWQVLAHGVLDLEFFTAWRSRVANDQGRTTVTYEYQGVSPQRQLRHVFRLFSRPPLAAFPRLRMKRGRRRVLHDFAQCRPAPGMIFSPSDMEARVSTTGLPVFDKTLQETHHWLGQVMERLATDDRQLAYSVLRATLHAVRDRIGPESAAHLGAQLPMLLRGVYYDGWKPTKQSVERHISDFVDHAAREMPIGKVGAPEAAVGAALAVIRLMIDPGEAQKVIQLFPAELREFWLSVR